MHIHHAGIVLGAIKDDEGWSCSEEEIYEVYPTGTYSPTSPSLASIPSPVLSPSPSPSAHVSPLLPSQRSPYHSPPRIDLTMDDEPLVDVGIIDLPSVLLQLPADFDPEPVFVMRDEEAYGGFWCDYCSIRFTRRSLLHVHERTVRHYEMMAFLNGEPMYWCAVCNLLPDMPFRHHLDQSHRRKVSYLRRHSRSSDLALRQVVMGANHRRVAILLPENV